MWFYTVSHGKLHDRGYSDILYGINSIDIMLHNHMVIITLFYLPDWALFWCVFACMNAVIIDRFSKNREEEEEEENEQH